MPEKLDYLRAIRRRLKPNGVLLHADICLERDSNIDLLKSTYVAHADKIGTDPEFIALELNAIEDRLVLSPDKFLELSETSGLGCPTELFRTLWYRCWVLRL